MYIQVKQFLKHNTILNLKIVKVVVKQSNFKS